MRNSREPAKARRIKVPPEEDMYAEYNEVDEFLQLLCQTPPIIWSESDDAYAEEFLSRFDSCDWQTLKEQLPSLSASDTIKLCHCLSPDEQAQLPVVMEVIRTDDPEVFNALLVRLFNCPTNESMPKEVVAELIGKALRLLLSANVPNRKLFWDVIEKYRHLAPEALQRQIPELHRQRINVNCPSGKASALMLDISDAALDHSAILLDLVVVSPKFVPMYSFYSWKQTHSARETIGLSLETNMVDMDLEVEITWL